MEHLIQEQLRKVAWDAGASYPPSVTCDLIALSMVRPHQGFICWQVQDDSIQELHKLYKERFNHSQFIVRIYDVTNILFNGTNAHSFFDIPISGLTGNYYFHLDRLSRDYFAELGFRLTDGHFHPLCRSRSFFFNSDRACGRYDLAGLCIDKTMTVNFSVENIFDAKELQMIVRAMNQNPFPRHLHIWHLFISPPSISPEHAAAMETLIPKLVNHQKEFSCDGQTFLSRLHELSEDIPDAAQQLITHTISRAVDAIVLRHQTIPMDVIHCYDWVSGLCGFALLQKFHIPFILTLTCDIPVPVKKFFPDFEKTVIPSATLITVPTESLKEILLSRYKSNPSRIAVHSLIGQTAVQSSLPDPKEIKQSFGIPPEAPLGLFVGEISHAAGADLLADSLAFAFSHHHNAHFIFAGEGPLKSELQNRAWGGGIGHRCHFLGDIDRDTFDRLVFACDFVAIPARTWQDESVARAAIDQGKPVLTTHQAHQRCIIHGENGLIAYDNMNSIIWGLNEMLSSKLHGSMMRFLSRQNFSGAPIQTPEKLALHFLKYYWDAVQKNQGDIHG